MLASVTDLSVGGFFVRTEFALVPGQEMSVQFALEPPVEAVARTVWRSDGHGDEHPAGVGFEFEEISPSGLHRLGFDRDEDAHLSSGRE
jgi:Tfp pilus assembly protein PilZ